MKIACITFTYPKDAIKAIISRQLIPKDWDHYWVVEEKDKDMPIPEGVKLIVTQAKRGTHLDSREFCKEYFKVLINLQRTGMYDIIVKVDSDTAVYKMDPFVWPIINCGVDFVYIKNIFISKDKNNKNSVKELCNGICYAFNARILNVFIKENKLIDKLIERFRGQEDLVISTFIKSLKFPLICNVDRSLVDWCTNRRNDEHTVVGHYGYKNNTNMINCVNEILEAQNKKPISLEDISGYINELNK